MSVLMVMEVVQICDDSSPRRLGPMAISLQAGKAVRLELPLLLKGTLSSYGCWRPPPPSSSRFLLTLCA
jgi:hypothetical protein